MATDDTFQNDDFEDEPEELDLSEATPVCPNCFEPVDPLDHYCKNCGEGSGQLTPYIPFVNIHYNYSIFGRMWNRVWQRDETPLPGRIFHFLLILIMAPIMLIGLPFTILRKHPRNPANHQQRP
jgi:hypothetical protein